MTVIIRAAALRDLDEAAEFYESQEPGLGADCYAFLEAEIDSLEQFAGIHARKHGFYRQVVRGRFPYFSIFYTMKNKVVEVVAVTDGRRDPDKNRHKLLER